MQATVRTFSPDTGSGTVLLDDGTQLAYDGHAFAASGLRLLRLGQRVRVRLTGAGPDRRVAALTLVTFTQPPAG